MFLATTALEEFWDRDKELVFLGEWCKTSKKGLDSYETMPYFWDNAQKVDNSASYCWDVYDAVADVLTDVLNNYHGVTKNRRYWEIITGNWLYSFIHVCYDRYVTLNRFIEKYPVFDTVVLSKKSYVTPMEYNDFGKKIKDDEYNLQLYSQILAFMGYEFSSKTCQTEQKNLFSNAGSDKKTKIFLNILNMFAFDSNITVTSPYFSNKMKSYIKLLSTSKGRFRFDEFNDSYSFNIVKERKSISLCDAYYGEDKFIKLLFTLFDVNFPLLYLEGYEEFRNYALNRKTYKSKLYVTSNAIIANYLYKFYIAENMDSLKLGCIQHGGYGVGVTNNSEKYERKVSDIFFTWGWEEDENTVALTHEKLNIKVKPDQEGYILLTMANMPRYVYRIQNSYNSDSFIKTYLPKTMSFLSNTKHKEKIFLRGHSISYETDYIDSIRERFPSITIDDNSKRFDQRLEKARLLVVDHMHTTYLEALASNFPVIIFVDKNYYSFRKPDVVKLLEEAKILFYDEKKAAEHIDEIYDDIGAWWFSKDVQSARDVFCSNYARGSDNWALEWTTKFYELTEGKHE